MALLTELLEHLEGEHADVTPVELLRQARLVPGWAIKPAVGRAPGTYEITGAGFRTRELSRASVIRLLQRHWIEQARAELARTP